MQFITLLDVYGRQIAIDKNRIKYIMDWGKETMIVADDNTYYVCNSFESVVAKCNAITIRAKDCNGGFLL